jgi:hypothetical protein
MSTTQLHELIPVKTPLGSGYAFILETLSHDYYWTVALDNCSIVTFKQDDIKICRSYTHGRSITHEEMKEIIK